jgi:hypothetical protein
MKSRTSVFGLAAVVLAGVGLIAYAANRDDSARAAQQVDTKSSDSAVEAGCPSSGCPFAAAAALLASETKDGCCSDDPPNCCDKSKSHATDSGHVRQVSFAHSAPTTDCGKDHHDHHTADKKDCDKDHDHEDCDHDHSHDDKDCDTDKKECDSEKKECDKDGEST